MSRLPKVWPKGRERLARVPADRLPFPIAIVPNFEDRAMRGRATAGIDRRTWLLGTGASWLASMARADELPNLDPETEAKAIEEQGRKAGLAPFRSVESKHYRVMGDAPEGYLKLTLGDCEAVSVDFFEYYRAQG